MMLAPDEEQLSFQTEVRRYLTRSWPTAVSRRSLEGGPAFDAGAWAGLCRMGVAGILVPDRYGGAGAGVAEAALVGEELGRLVVAAPFLSSAVTAAVLLTGLAEAGDEVARERLPGVAEGTVIATVAALDAAGRWDAHAVSVEARQDGTGWVLDGEVRYVTDLGSADLVLVVARTPTGLAVFALGPKASGVERAPLVCLDATQPVGRLRMRDAPAVRLAPGLSGDRLVRLLDRTAAVTVACLCAMQVGGAEQCLDMAVEYAGRRTQFGRTIGSFQAVKHRCADMLARVESARSVTHHLVSAVESDAPDLAVAVSLAKSFCADAVTSCASDALQIHGGIGFTWEHDIHLYLKRARATAHLFGDAVHHRERLAALLVGEAAGRQPGPASPTAAPTA
ncbi:acyl-CoA dehydrogenase family protein [Streptomyces sp. CWNU-52B]|uniref:acyl-CoA dehydrogenase family protein n=1 Tax=unclassified Streptomyces TaxID=2593676 RepID=UPI0039BEF021